MLNHVFVYRFLIVIVFVSAEIDRAFVRDDGHLVYPFLLNVSHYSVAFLLLKGLINNK